MVYKDAADPAKPPPRQVAMNWAQRLKRVFGIEIEGCARCGGKLKILASIDEPQVIAKIQRPAGGPAGLARPGLNLHMVLP